MKRKFRGAGGGGGGVCWLLVLPRREKFGSHPTFPTKAPSAPAVRTFIQPCAFYAQHPHSYNIITKCSSKQHYTIQNIPPRGSCPRSAVAEGARCACACLVENPRVKFK